jgi:hypothetical protein
VFIRLTSLQHLLHFYVTASDYSLHVSSAHKAVESILLNGQLPDERDSAALAELHSQVNSNRKSVGLKEVEGDMYPAYKRGF